MPDPVLISMLARQDSLFENINSKNMELNSERKALSCFPFFFPLKMDINISGACNLYVFIYETKSIQRRGHIPSDAT